MNGYRFKIICVNSAISAMAGSTNCIVIQHGGRAVVVDPGGEGDRIARFLKRRRLSVSAYWLTHGHPDHVGGLSDLVAGFPAPIRYHKADAGWLKMLSPIMYFKMRKWFSPFGRIRMIADGEIAAKVIHSPGHSRGSVCYWFEDDGVLLSGDTLMRGCVGATIYPGGDSGDLDISFQKIFRKVSDDTRIFPGHGAVTTVGAEHG